MVGYGTRRYEIKGISHLGTQLKATIKAFDGSTSDSPNSRFELSTIDLYSTRSREWFAKLCVGILGEREELLKEDLNRLLEKVEGYQSLTEEKKGYQPSEDEKKEAMEFLGIKDLFSQILKDFEILGYTRGGDE